MNINDILDCDMDIVNKSINPIQVETEQYGFSSNDVSLEIYGLARSTGVVFYSENKNNSNNIIGGMCHSYPNDLLTIDRFFDDFSINHSNYTIKDIYLTGNSMDDFTDNSEFKQFRSDIVEYIGLRFPDVNLTVKWLDNDKSVNLEYIPKHNQLYEDLE